MTLRHRDWPWGWEAEDGTVRWGDVSIQAALQPRDCLAAALFGCLAEACAELERGPVRVWGATGLETLVDTWLATVGMVRSDDSRQAIDLAAEALTHPAKLADLPDEALIVCMVHPGHPMQSYDFYSTIHRHSLTVRFRLWGLPNTMSPVEGEFAEGDWLVLD